MVPRFGLTRFADRWPASTGIVAPRFAAASRQVNGFKRKWLSE